MVKYKNLTVEVTQEHINEGTPVNCNECAMSLAFNDALVKAYGSQCLVTTSMSDGEVSLKYCVDSKGYLLTAILDSDIINLQYKIDAFVNEYDNNFLANDGHNTMPLANFTPKHCVPFTFDVRLPV
jgi:hypothetical protein